MNNRHASRDTGTRKSCALECLICAALVLTPLALIVAYFWPW